jgi:hypothetical protein
MLGVSNYLVKFFMQVKRTFSWSHLRRAGDKEDYRKARPLSLLKYSLGESGSRKTRDQSNSRKLPGNTLFLSDSRKRTMTHKMWGKNLLKASGKIEVTKKASFGFTQLERAEDQEFVCKFNQ